MRDPFWYLRKRLEKTSRGSKRYWWFLNTTVHRIRRKNLVNFVNDSLKGIHRENSIQFRSHDMCKDSLNRNLLPFLPYGHRWWHIHLDSLVVGEVLEFKSVRFKMRDPNKQDNSSSLPLELLAESSIRHQIAVDSECYSFPSDVNQLSKNDLRICSQVPKLSQSLHSLVKQLPPHTMNEEGTYSRYNAEWKITAVRSKPEFCI